METLKEIIFGDYKIYLGFALFGSLIAVIQLVLSFFFGGGDFDVDGDGEVALGEHLDSGFGDFRFISIRSVVAFFAFFGWGGVISYENGLKGLGAFFIALVFGLIMMFITALLLYFMLKMQHSGNIDPGDIIGSLGTVYLRVPAGRTEIGKVTAEVKGTSQEIIAVADEEIPRGCSVKVVEQVDGKRYLVEKV